MGNGRVGGGETRLARVEVGGKALVEPRDDSLQAENLPCRARRAISTRAPRCHGPAAGSICAGSSAVGK